MNRAQFLAALRAGLSGLPPDEIEDIVSDYQAHFDEGVAAGRTESDVAQALGDPKRLARELRAESGLRRWETHRSAGNFFAALLALTGLATFDVIILLPVLFLLWVLLVISSIVAFVLLLAGLATLFGSLIFLIFSGGSGVAFAVLLAAIGLTAAGIGGGAVIMLLVTFSIQLLGSYARLHYRLAKPTDGGAS